MKVELEDLQGRYKKISIEIPAESVEKHVQQHFVEIQKQVELKGFRKGKAPLKMVQELYGETEKGRIIRRLVEEHLFDAIQEKSLEPVGMPKVDVEALLYNSPFKFSATFEVMPPVVLKDYKGFSPKTENVNVESSDVEATLENAQRQSATFENIEEAVSPGLFVRMDYEASEAGQPVPEATQKNGFVEIGKDELFADFEKEIVGLKAGDVKEFTVKFPQPEKEEDRLPVSGRTIDFRVSVLAVQKQVLPELNDEFAKKIGFESLEQLKNRVSDDLKRTKENTIRRENQEKLVDYLIATNPVEAPETLLNSQMEQLATDAGLQLSRMGLQQQAIEERLKEWGDEMAKRAERQVKASLLLGAIAKQENIQANDEDLRNEIVNIAQQTNSKPQDVWEDLRSKNLVGGLVRQLTELKALNWVLSDAQKGT